jgi:RNA polymerase-binding transcription factor DksA
MAARRTQSRPTRRRKAATADIVGGARGQERVPAKWRKHYDRLMELRDYLLDRKGEQVRDATDERPAFSLHMADAGTDSYDRDFALSRISAEQEAVYEIEEALDRIRTGTFGICEVTGKPIEPRRLEAIPWTRFSAEAEKKLERDGDVRRTRLSAREAVVRTVNESGESEESAGDERRQRE